MPPLFLILHLVRRNDKGDTHTHRPNAPVHYFRTPTCWSRPHRVPLIPSSLIVVPIPPSNLRHVNTAADWRQHGNYRGCQKAAYAACAVVWTVFAGRTSINALTSWGSWEKKWMPLPDAPPGSNLKVYRWVKTDAKQARYVTFWELLI